MLQGDKAWVLSHACNGYGRFLFQTENLSGTHDDEQYLISLKFQSGKTPCQISP